MPPVPICKKENLNFNPVYGHTNPASNKTETATRFSKQAASKECVDGTYKLASAPAILYFCDLFGGIK